MTNINRRRFPILLASALALLAILGALLLPITAQAQTATVLVSNIGQTSDAFARRGCANGRPGVYGRQWRRQLHAHVDRSAG